MASQTKQHRDGYVISYHGKSTEFFTASSSYDRPRWVSLDEATVYLSADLASEAAKKLWRSGSISAKIKPLQEVSLDLEMPNEQPPAPTMTAGDTGQDDEMVASQQQDSGEDEIRGSCPDCDCDPCECQVDDLESDTDALDQEPIADDEVDGNVVRLGDVADEVPPSDGYDETDPRTWDKRDGMQDEETLVGQHVKAAAGMESEEVARLHPKELKMLGKKRLDMKESVKLPSPGSNPASPSENKDTVNSIAKPKELDVSDKVNTSKDELKLDHEEKVKVPSDIKTELKSVIAELDRVAKSNENRNDEKASFAMTASSALKQVADELDKGTVESIKQAQVLISSFMSPITSYIPSEVIKFVARGGQKPTLKDLFATKRQRKDSE